MNKRKRTRKRSPSGERRRGQRLGSYSQLAGAYRQAEQLIDGNEPEAALELLEPLLADHPQIGKLRSYVGHARLMAGDDYGAIDAFERAAKLLDYSEEWMTFATACLELQLNATALPALRRALSLEPPDDRVEALQSLVDVLQEEVRALAARIGIPERQTERGLRAMHDGDRALHRTDYRASIAASRRAAGLLRDYPPPLNNLAIALFFDGRPKEAIAAAKNVLASDPNNIHALSHAIRFLFWTGQEEDARELWPRLRAVKPGHVAHRHKIAEAAAVLGDDESVYAVLEPLGDATPEDLEWSVQAQRMLAIAEANLGHRHEALSRLRRLGSSAPNQQALITALEAGRAGIGWADRFPYFALTEFIPAERLLDVGVVELLGPDASLDRANERIDRFVARFPQIVLVAEKIIWEEAAPQAAVPLLAAIGTPEARAALRRYGLSQAGPDGFRMDALGHLVAAGEIAQGEECRVWLEGEWRVMAPSLFEASDDPELDYRPEVRALLAAAEIALADKDFSRAERFLREVLELEPEAKEAYNNLATIYMGREDIAQATAMYEAALRIDPTYVFPRGSLATLRLQEHDVAGANEILAPLADVQDLGDLGKAYYCYVLARVSLEEEDYAAARAHLNTSLNAIPNYPQALRLVDALDAFDEERVQYQKYIEGARERSDRRRARLQSAISTPTPSLREALSVHTKASLTAMARLTLVWGGWSGLRKAELRDDIERTLRDEAAMRRLVGFLQEEALEALRMVLGRGGSMGWDDFDALFGNDLDEYPYWEYQAPATTMGLLRARGLLAEAMVDGEMVVTIPRELRPVLEDVLKWPSRDDGRRQ